MHPFTLARVRAEATRDAGDLVSHAIAGLFHRWRRRASLGDRNATFRPGDPG